MYFLSSPVTLQDYVEASCGAQDSGRPGCTCLCLLSLRTSRLYYIVAVCSVLYTLYKRRVCADNKPTIWVKVGLLHSAAVTAGYEISVADFLVTLDQLIT